MLTLTLRLGRQPFMSGVALAMLHRLSGLMKGDGHPAYAPVEYGTFTFTVTLHLPSLLM